MSINVNDFFDLNKPCPCQIPNCEQLRKEYKQALQEKEAATCKSCELLKIKTKYMEIVWNAFFKAL